MPLTFSGLGSGLDYDNWIKELVAIKQADIDKVSKQVSGIKKQEDTLSTLEGHYQDLLDAISVFTKALSEENVFNQKKATSSSEAVTVEASFNAEIQDLTVSVSQLATATVAKSASNVASYVDLSTIVGDISEGSIQEGTFSIYVNGSKTSINITSEETMQDVLDDLNDITGVSASLSAEGKLTIESTDSGIYTVNAGSSSDTSNFSNVMSLTRDTETGVYSSSKSIFDTDTGEALTTASFAGGTVTTGTFTIGSAEFTIDSSTTLDDLINKININEDAGVAAYWDPNAGKLILTAEDEGAININIEAGTSNFTDIMGLTNSGVLAEDSQALGTNAILTVNGTTITSASNTVKSDVSGIPGLTLTLNDETTSTETISITQDATEITDAITDFVSAYNMAITATDDATTTDGNLYGESILNSLRNKIRKLVTASVNGEEGYNTLASIGITTGSFSTNTSADTTQLKLDSDKLLEALTDNPNAVKKLLIGDSINEGVFDKIENILDNSLDVVNGYFVSREKSYDKQADRLNDKIEKMTEDLEKYETRLEAKFQAMDTLISALEQNASVFDSYFNKSDDKKS